MKINFQNKISLILSIISFQLVLAQKKEGNIESEVVDIVKSYNATVMDASKINESPSIENEPIVKKEPIKYTILSFPVASTFVPIKGKAEEVNETKKEHIYSNYATLGFGNYATINAEVFLNQELKNKDYIGAMLRHLSTQGNLKNVDLNSAFSTNAIDLFYGSKINKATIEFDAGFKKQTNNWFGLPAKFGETLTLEEKNSLINNINPKNSFTTFAIGGKLNLDEGIFQSTVLKYNNFTDAFNASENRFILEPSFNFEIMAKYITTKLIVDYVGGKFKEDYKKTNTEIINYGYTNIGLTPSFETSYNDWTFNLGLKLFSSTDSGNSKNSFFIYPQIQANYKIIDKLLFFYSGIEGGLEQNSYQRFINVNPFLSPTMENKTAPNYIKPTDNQYDIFAGLKGKFTNSISYNLKVSYMSQKNKALFKSNDYTENNTNNDYAFGNAFQIVYDNLKTLSFSGDLKATILKDVDFGLSGTINSFKNDLEKEVWNLPLVQLNSNIAFTINEKWDTGLSLFYIGQRKDVQQNLALTTNSITEIANLKSYVDLNASLGYKYNNSLTGFLKINNILNQSYQKWLNYPVQGFQIMIGANYKFDF